MGIRTNFEYKTVTIDLATCSYNYPDEALNEYGAFGWEVVSERYRGSEVVYLMKRRYK